MHYLGLFCFVFLVVVVSSFVSLVVFMLLALL